jgi:uncharacterized damage-inducible protein DinB
VVKNGTNEGYSMMTNQEMLARHLELVYAMVGRNVEGMTHDQSLARPVAGGNCANWILGHLVNVHNRLMQVLGEEPVWESAELARAGFDPIESPERAIEWDTLRDRFLGSQERCLAAVRALTDDAMADELPAPFGGATSRAGLLVVLAFHQTYHAGQLGLARRFAGLPGVIKAPGQKEAEAGRSR